MDSLVGYGSDDDVDERYVKESRGGGGGSGAHRREDDTNYDDVTMDMSEDSNNNESDRELPQATDRDRRPSPPRSHGREKSQSPSRERRPDARERETYDRRDHREKRSDRGRGGSSSPSSSSSSGRRGHDKTERRADTHKLPSLMDQKPFGGERPPSLHAPPQARPEQRDRERDRDGRSERERDRREPERERRRDRDSHSTRDKDRRRSPERRHKRRSHSRSRSRDRRAPRDTAPPPRADKSEHNTFPARGLAAAAPGPSSDYRPSYKVSKKLQVMEKMGLQIKTPDGSMATAQELMQRTVAEQNKSAGDLPSYYNSGAVNASKLVQKRKLLWGKKEEAPSAPAAPTPQPAAAKWTGTRFDRDTDGKVASKFMRLMGIKDPDAVKPPADLPPEVDVNRKQQEMFEAMQAQYDVARATTHTMRGVGLGFQRHL